MRIRNIVKGLAVLAAFAALAVIGGTMAPRALAGGETLTGGGPGGSEWDVDNEGGTDNGLPTGGQCDSEFGGMTVDDATLDPGDTTTIGAQSDAYDNGLILWLDNAIYDPPGTTVTGSTFEGDPSSMSGLDVTMQYYAAADTATLRAYVTLTNTGDADVNTTATWTTNVGSDSSTVVTGSSSGDTAFAAADRWVVTADDDEEPSDPVNTHVLFGPGSPAVTSSSVSQTVFNCAGTEGVLATFDITVPAGATRALLFFNQLSQTNEDAATGATAFDTNPAVGSDLLDGLSEQQLGEVLNWDFGVAPPPEPTATTPPGETPGAPTGGVDVTVSDDSPAPGDTVDVTATATDADGSPIEGAECTFRIYSQPGDDASVGEGPVTTDANGQATTTLDVGSTVGTVEVLATCGAFAEVLAVEVGVALPPTGAGGGASDTTTWLVLSAGLAALGLGALSLRMRRG
ncbi:MAG: Ig-like domain-containing protein [Dehalococcoidia bacterium]